MPYSESTRSGQGLLRTAARLAALTEARSPGSGSTPLVVGWSNSGMCGMTSFISTCRSPAYWLWEVCRSPLAGILQTGTGESAQAGSPQAGCEALRQPTGRDPAALCCNPSQVQMPLLLAVHAAARLHRFCSPKGLMMKDLVACPQHIDFGSLIISSDSDDGHHAVPHGLVRHAAGARHTSMQVQPSSSPC